MSPPPIALPVIIESLHKKRMPTSIMYASLWLPEFYHWENWLVNWNQLK